jgi:streptogramin lyase
VAGLVAALAAAGVWLTDGDTGDARGARPAAAAVERSSELAVEAGDEAATPTEQETGPIERRLCRRTEARVARSCRSGGPIVSLATGTLVRVDARSGEILARIAVPSPKLLASDGRSVWVLGEGGALVRVKAATNAVTGVFDVSTLEGEGGSAAIGLAAIRGSVWLSDADEWAYRLGPGAGESRPVVFGLPDRTTLYFVGGSQVAAAGSLWVTAFPPGACCLPPPDLYRIDPLTSSGTGRFDGVGRVVAAGPGFVWALSRDVLTNLPGLVRIDTDTHAITPIGALGFVWTDLTVTDGAVWASSPVDDALVRLDPVTGKEENRVRLRPATGAPRSGALAAGAGAVWAAHAGQVERYDVEADVLETIDVGGAPVDLVAAGDSIWVAVSPADGAPGGVPA